MNAESEIKENSEEVKITDSAPVYGRGMPLYVLLPLCALASTFICTGGWRTGLRATLLGGSLLLGVWVIKKLCPADISWWKRVAYFALLGIFSGLLAALIIWGMEMLTDSPTLNNNPYNQATKNLFFVCPLYGFFMLGCFGMAFKLSRMRRFFIILAGAALANTFCLVDLVPDRNFLKILLNCAIYYIPCLGNCAWYMILWVPCAEKIFNLPVEKKSVGKWTATIILGGIAAYFLFIVIGVFAAGIKIERFMVQNKDTVFKDKLNGIIVDPHRSDYYDCQKQSFYEIPKNTRINKGYNSNNKFLKAVDNRRSIEIEKLENNKVIKKIIPVEWYGKPVVVNDTVYYRDKGKLWSLNPPDYDKPEIVLKKFNGYRFSISPNEKFIVYYGGVTGPIGRSVLCVMNLRSKKILALRVSAYHGLFFWVNNLDDLRMPEKSKKEGVRK